MRAIYRQSCVVILIVAHLFKYLEDQCAYQIYPKNGRTFPSLLPIHGLDFILVPPSYRVMRCEILRCYVSDHRPVVVDLEILNKLK